MSFGIKDATLKKIIGVFHAAPGVTKAQIYGSRARDTHKPYSDIDIVVWGDLDNSDIAHIRFELEELPTLYKFDVLHYDTLTHQGLKDHIDRVGKNIYVRETERA